MCSHMESTINLDFACSSWQGFFLFKTASKGSILLQHLSVLSFGIYAFF